MKVSCNFQKSGRKLECKYKDSIWTLLISARRGSIKKSDYRYLPVTGDPWPDVLHTAERNLVCSKPDGGLGLCTAIKNFTFASQNKVLLAIAKKHPEKALWESNWCFELKVYKVQTVCKWSGAERLWTHSLLSIWQSCHVTQSQVQNWNIVQDKLMFKRKERKLSSFRWNIGWSCQNNFSDWETTESDWGHKNRVNWTLSSHRALALTINLQGRSQSWVVLCHNFL